MITPDDLMSVIAAITPKNNTNLTYKHISNTIHQLTVKYYVNAYNKLINEIPQYYYEWLINKSKKKRGLNFIFDVYLVSPHIGNMLINLYAVIINYNNIINTRSTSISYISINYYNLLTV